jgi:hypothetical protein
VPCRLLQHRSRRVIAGRYVPLRRGTAEHAYRVEVVSDVPVTHRGLATILEPPAARQSPECCHQLAVLHAHGDRVTIAAEDLQHPAEVHL